MASLDVQVFFDRLSHLESLQDWSQVHGGPEGQIASSVQQKTTVVRVTRTTDAITWDEKLLLMRPEVRSDVASMGLGFLVDAKLVEALGPGDAVVECKMREDMPQAWMRAFSLTSSLSADLTGDWITFRMSLWRDFPRSGQFSLSIMPVKAAASAHPAAYFIVVTKGGEGEGITMQHFMEVPWPEYPAWMTPPLLELLQQANIEATFKPEAIAKCSVYYTVVNLRSCSRGPPLLPVEEADTLSKEERQRRIEAREAVEMGGYLWAPAKKEGFNLPKYLDLMLKHSGSSFGTVFDRLDGLQLAPYQAVLVACELEHSRESFDKLFRVQQAAYRRLLGGKHAPKMNFGTTPHFVSAAQKASRALEEVVEHKTFLEVKCVVEDETPRPTLAAEYP